MIRLKMAPKHVGIDDIEDNSILRRGIPVAHSIYGIPSTISAANYILLTGLKRLQCLNHPEVLSMCTEHLFNFFWGQTLEIYWRDNYICPSEEDYLEMNKRRMYGFFMLEIGLMKLLSDNKADFTHLIRTMAQYIQIRNDYISLCLQQYSKDKGYFDDITEGKFSFPIIHAIKSRPDDNQVIHILRQRTRDLELKKYCVALLEKFGSFSYTRKTLEKLDAEIRAEVAKHGGNPQLQALLDELLNWKRTEEKDPEQ